MRKVEFKLNKVKFAFVWFFVLICSVNVSATEPVTEFRYHGAVDIDGWTYYVNLTGDIGKAMLTGPASTNTAAARGITRAVMGPWEVLKFLKFKGSELELTDKKTVDSDKDTDGDGYDDNTGERLPLIIRGYPFFGSGTFIQARAMTKGVDDSDEGGGVIIDPDKEYTCELQDIGENACMDNEDITSILLPNSVITIWQGAFANCPNLESVTIPSSVAALGWRSFQNCPKLESIEIPGSVLQIGESAFQACTGLKTVVMLEGVKKLYDGVFSECGNLSSVALPPSLEEIGAWAFNETGSLKGTITLPASLAKMGSYAFTESGIEELDFASGAILSGISAGAFYSCNSLKKVTLPSSVIQIGDEAFSQCKSLEQIVFSQNLQKINRSAFLGCTSLKEITLPKSLKTIGEQAFSVCSSLETITCSFTSPMSIPDNAFSEETYRNARLVVPEGTRTIYQATAGWKNFLNIDDGTDETERIIFEDDAVKAVCVANWDTNSDGELSSQEASVVSDLEGKFSNNKAITSFDELRYFTGLNALTMVEFEGCSNLSTITIPKNVTSFSGSYDTNGNRIESYILAEGNTSLSVADGIVYNKAKTILMACPTNKSGAIVIPETVTEIKSYAFSGCKLVTSLTLPASLQKIGFGAFQACTFEDITLPAAVNAVTGGAFVNAQFKRIDVDATSSYFKSADGVLYSKDGKTLVAYPFLKTDDYEIPDGTTSIGEYAFYGSKISKLTLASTITTIGMSAISNCYISTIVSNITDPQSVSVSENAFNYSGFLLFVPDGTKNLYQTADVWKNRTRIKEMSEKTPGAIIFADPSVEAICLDKFDNNFDGVLTEEEASTVSSLGNAFTGNKQITSFNELKYFKGLTQILENDFKGCSSLTSVTLPPTVTYIVEKAFYGCNFKTFNIPKQVSFIGGGLCAGNSDLEMFVVDPDNTNYQTIEGVLYNKKGTNTNTYPAHKTALVSYPNKKGSRYVIPEESYVAAYSFYSSDIEELTIPSEVSFGGHCFADCSHLKTIISLMDGSISSYYPYDDMFPTSVYENATLKVVYGNKDSYQEIDGWKKFKNIIEMADSEPITLTANSYTIEYGEPIPTFAFTSKGGHLSGTPAIICEGSTLLNAGTYPIIIKQGSVENANVTYVNGTLTINKAPLTIKAGSYTKYLNQDDPEYTLAYEGFKNNESEDILLKKPSVASNAISESPEGTYQVTVSGAMAKNYEITCVNGTLTIKILMGDVNGDGSVTMDDVNYLANYIMGKRSNILFKSANLNGDDKLDAADIVILVNQLKSAQ